MERKNFIIARTKNGVLYKRYYNIVRDERGLKRPDFYYSRRLNLPEQLLYKYTTYYDKPTHGKKQRSIQKLPYFALATILAGSILVGGIVASSNDSEASYQPSNSDKYTSAPTKVISSTESSNSQILENVTTNQTTPAVAPTPVTYVDNGTTFISLDSSLEISKYNYANLVKELEEYNASVTESQRYDFDTDMFDHAVFTGVQIRESSLVLYDANDTSYKGGFKIGSSALKEANEVSQKLTGKPIISDTDELDDPVLSNKACMYIYIKNYQYLQDHIDKNNLNVTVTPQMVMDTYLYGCGNIMKELSNGGYEQKIYSMDITSYADIVRDFSDAIFEDGITGDERTQARRKTFNKLYQVPETNKTILAQRNAEKGE